MVEKLPAAYGLVRYGVAPDHPEVKNVMGDFGAVAEDPRFRFLGNVELSGDADPSSSGPSGSSEGGEHTERCDRTHVLELSAEFSLLTTGRRGGQGWMRQALLWRSRRSASWRCLTLPRHPSLPLASLAPRWGRRPRPLPHGAVGGGSCNGGAGGAGGAPRPLPRGCVGVRGRRGPAARRARRGP